MPAAHVSDLRAELGATPIERDVVRVTGPEALGFLQGQLSQDVEALAAGATARTLLLAPTGKVDAWLRVTRLADDDLLLDVDAGHGAVVDARLRRFRLRTKAEIAVATWVGVALRGPGSGDVAAPPGALVLPAGWPGVDGVDVLVDPSTGTVLDLGVAPAAPGALEALRVECGVPAMGAELTEATIPAEAGAWLIEASVSFTKGCYTGQELVARIDSRGGNVPRPVRALLVDGAAVPRGAEVWLAGGSPEHAVGSVTSSATSPVLGSIALAVLTRSVEVGAGVEVRWPDGRASATVTELPLR